jgi:hypothetical protein
MPQDYKETWTNLNPDGTLKSTSVSEKRFLDGGDDLTYQSDLYDRDGDGSFEEVYREEYSYTDDGKIEFQDVFREKAGADGWIYHATADYEYTNGVLSHEFWKYQYDTDPEPEYTYEMTQAVNDLGQVTQRVQSFQNFVAIGFGGMDTITFEYAPDGFLVKEVRDYYSDGVIDSIVTYEPLIA